MPRAEALLEPGRLALTGAVAAVVDRRAYRKRVERVGKARLRLNRPAMRRLLSEDEQPRLLVWLPDPLDGVVGDDGRVVAVDAASRAVDVELVVEVVALAAMAHPVIEARTLGVVVLTHVPLADVRRLVTCRFQAERVAREAVGVLGEVVQHLVAPGVSSAEEGRATRRAERRGDEGVGEARALGRQAIEVRRLQPGEQRLLSHLALDHAERIPALVIGEDDEDVGTPRGAGGACACAMVETSAQQTARSALAIKEHDSTCARCVHFRLFRNRITDSICSSLSTPAKLGMPTPPRSKPETTAAVGSRIDCRR